MTTPPARPGHSRWAILRWVLAMGVFLAGQGYLLLAFAIWSSASLPYQDAPPELLARQQREVMDAHTELKTAAIVALVSSLWLAVKVVRAWRARRRA